MGGLTLLDQARVAGLTVTVKGDRLAIKGPQCADALARELIARKAEVMAELLAATPLVAPAKPDPLGRLTHCHRTPWGTLCWSDPRDRSVPAIEAFGPPPPLDPPPCDLTPPAEATAPPPPPPSRPMWSGGSPPSRPWNRILRTWSILWREHWGRRANELFESGVPFPDDERQAFAEVSAERERGAMPPATEPSPPPRPAPAARPRRPTHNDSMLPFGDKPS
jgi:hypothetical protein